jgi:fatty acid-binding protein DegV
MSNKQEENIVEEEEEEEEEGTRISNLPQMVGTLIPIKAILKEKDNDKVLAGLKFGDRSFAEICEALKSALTPEKWQQHEYEIQLTRDAMDNVRKQYQQ